MKCNLKCVNARYGTGHRVYCVLDHELHSIEEDCEKYTTGLEDLLFY